MADDILTLPGDDAPPLDFFGDADGSGAVQAEPATLERVTNLALAALELEAELLVDSVALEEKNARLQKILRYQIPDILKELQLAEFKMESGHVISQKESINASISEANKPAAFKWLEDEQCDGIIKTKLLSEFGKGEYAKAVLARAEMEKAGYACSLDRGVHPATLKSFVKERLEAGKDLPQELFGVHKFTAAVIKAPPKKKPSKK